jgi:hypothetical protein
MFGRGGAASFGAAWAHHRAANKSKERFGAQRYSQTTEQSGDDRRRRPFVSAHARSA